ncbi:MAG: MATE family efflux transporter [Lachnospiraceae bacterium]|nr:MATE family efflux transporter [Lachnospiraceae bacterium]
MKEQSNIYQKALYLAVPMMIQNGITNAVTLVDNLMVGSLGTESMTAVSIAAQMIFVLNLGIFGGLSGPGIFAAQYFGAGDKEGVRKVFRLKWWIGLTVVAIGALVFALFGGNLIELYLHGTSEDIDPVLTHSLSLSYLHIMIASLLPFCVTQIYANSLRETGESIRPMVAGLISVATDILFNYLLIYGKMGLPALGVSGAAVATVIARIVEMSVLVIWTHLSVKEGSFFKGVYKTLLVPVKVALPVVMKGLPMFLNEFLWAGGMAVLTMCYSTRGLEVVAGFNISNSICNVLNVVFISLGGSVGILIGQILGTGDYDSAKKNGIKLMWFSGFLCIFLSVILILLAFPFPKLYNTTEEVRRLGRWIIIITALFFPIQGFLNALYFTLRSGGKTLITMLFDSVYTWFVVVAVAAGLCFLTPLPVLVVYVLVQMLDLIKIAIGYFLIQKGVWLTKLS